MWTKKLESCVATSLKQCVDSLCERHRHVGVSAALAATEFLCLLLMLVCSVVDVVGGGNGGSRFVGADFRSKR
jgi:hypothetical protein